MSLENFQLPLALIPELYKNSLVQLEDKQTSKDNIEVEEIKYAGRNLKNILILVADADAVHLSDAPLEFLGQILQACKLNLNDVAIVNLYNNPHATFQSSLNAFKPTLVIDFGSVLKKWNPELNSMLYQEETMDHITIIRADHLPSIAQKPELKKQLWLTLKSHFKL